MHFFETFIAWILNSEVHKNCVLTQFQRDWVCKYVQEAVKFWNIDDPYWQLPMQFQRAGRSLTKEEREQLLLRSAYIFGCQVQEYWSLARTRFLSDLLAHYRCSSRWIDEKYVYPWKDLEVKLRSNGCETLKLFGFGSLINAQSASTNITSARGPAIAFGLKRIFNYRDHSLCTCNIGCPAKGYDCEQAKLNAALTKDPCHMINGVLYDISADDLVNLRLREQGYDLEKLAVVDFKDALDEKICQPQIIEAYYLRATNPSQISNDYEPDINYVNVCTEGARFYGPAFTKLFFDTTYLCDGFVSLNQWLMNKVRDLALKISPPPTMLPMEAYLSLVERMCQSKTNDDIVIQ